MEANILRSGAFNKVDVQITSQIKMNASHDKTATNVSSPAKAFWIFHTASPLMLTSGT